MTQTREKWDSLILSRAGIIMVGRCDCIPCFYFLFLIFLFRSNGIKEHLDKNDFRHGYGNYFKSAVLKITWFQLRSKFFLNNYEAHWQRHLKDTLHLKILRTWINIHANSFFGKYHEIKMGEGALGNYQFHKNSSLFLKKIAPGQFNYYCILLCLSNKPSF